MTRPTGSYGTGSPVPLSGTPSVTDLGWKSTHHPRGTAAHPVRGTVPRHVWILFLMACLYVVFPFVDIPLLGISLSAPLFFLILVDVFLRGVGLDRTALHQWRGPVLLLIVGLVVSFFGSFLLYQDRSVSVSDLLLLVRYIYWFVVFLATTVVVSNLAQPGRLARLLGWAGIALAAVRLLEMGRVGIGGQPELLTKNSYGFLFSSLFPFVLLVAMGAKRRRLIAFLGIAVFAAGVALTGSRGSWLAILAEFTILGLFMSGRPFRLRFLKLAAVLAGIMILGLVLAPGRIVEPMAERADSFQELDEDKSVLVRKVMQQKAWRLFKDSPVVGVGPGGFQKAMVNLPLPARLKYYGQEQINRRSSHNSWAQLLAETGLVGTVPFAVLFALLVLKGRRAATVMLSRRVIWPLAFWVSILGMSIHMWVVAALTGTHTWLFYGMVAGMIAWQQRMSSREQNKLAHQEKQE